MATPARPGAVELSPSGFGEDSAPLGVRLSPVVLHPLLQSVDDELRRVSRAAYWLCADMDFRHTGYWRRQLGECERRYLASFVAPSRSEHEPEAVKCRRDALETELRRQHELRLGQALLLGFNRADKRPYRSGVTIPETYETPRP